MSKSMSKSLLETSASLLAEASSVSPSIDLGHRTVELNTYWPKARMHLRNFAVSPYFDQVSEVDTKTFLIKISELDDIISAIIKNSKNVK